MAFLQKDCYFRLTAVHVHLCITSIADAMQSAILIESYCAQWMHRRLLYLALTHGNTGTVPKSLLGLSCFVVIMSAGTQRGAQFIPVLGQSLQNNRSDDTLIQDRKA